MVKIREISYNKAMSEIYDIDKELKAFLEPVKNEECSPEHDAWIKEQIKATLAKKQAGDMAYHSLDDVMQKFGFNAR